MVVGTAGVGAGLQVQGQPRSQRRLGGETEEGERGKEEKEREREKGRRNKVGDTKEKDLEDRTLAFLIAFLLPV